MYRSSQACQSSAVHAVYSASRVGSSPKALDSLGTAPPPSSSTQSWVPSVRLPQVSPNDSYSEPSGESKYSWSHEAQSSAAQASHSASRVALSPWLPPVRLLVMSSRLFSTTSLALLKTKKNRTMTIRMISPTTPRMIHSALFDFLGAVSY